MAAMSVWTDERIEILKARWTSGLSTSAIAAELGNGISKNAVIGKIHRLGLQDQGGVRERAPRMDRPKRERVEGGAPRIRRVAVRATSPVGQLFNRLPRYVEEPVDLGPLEMPETQFLGREAILGLGPQAETCRWPVGDPRDDDFRFCGCKPSTNSPYCAHHVRMAYSPSQKKLRQAV